jgi:hypothetical protein
MFFAPRTKQRFKIVFLGTVAYALMVLALALLAPVPNVPFSTAYGRWLLGIPAMLVAWACLELISTWSLNRQFWSRMSRWSRIALFVALICLFAVAAVWLSSLWQARDAA